VQNTNQQGDVMQNGSKQTSENSESNAHEPDRQLGSSTPGRCPAHSVGSMLNPLAFDELAAGGEDVWITCSGQLYRLRRTKLEKLILTK